MSHSAYTIATRFARFYSEKKCQCVASVSDRRSVPIPSHDEYKTHNCLLKSAEHETAFDMAMNPWQWMQVPSYARVGMVRSSASVAPLETVHGVMLKQGEMVPVLSTSSSARASYVYEPSISNASVEVQLAREHDTGGVLPRTQSVSIEVPMHLPPPIVNAFTNPYTDLPQHLRHYGLVAEAIEFGRTKATCDFVLEAFLTVHKMTGGQTCQPGSAALVSEAGEELMHALEHFMRAREPSVHEQLACTAMTVSSGVPAGHVALPLRVSMPWTSPNGMRSLHTPSMPTHILAICTAAQPMQTADLTLCGHVVTTPCTLVPVHWIVYVLQCTKLPVPHGTQSTDEIPLVPLSVPYVQHWPIIHRWLYTKDPAKLLASLVPLSHVLQHVHGDEVAASPTIDALAYVSLAVLLRIALKIRATWHNARAVGLVADTFWTTLSRAWDMVVCAMVLRKARVPPRVVPASV